MKLVEDNTVNRCFFSSMNGRELFEFDEYDPLDFYSSFPIEIYNCTSQFKMKLRGAKLIKGVHFNFKKLKGEVYCCPIKIQIND